MTFDTNTLWFEIAVITGIFALGPIFFGHFEIYTPKWKRVLKLFLFTALACSISAFFGRARFFGLLAVLAGMVVLIHAWWLPKKGINGLTAEPKEKYYALRGWVLKE